MPLVVDTFKAGSIDVTQSITINGQPISGGGGIEGTQYIFVAGNGTPEENATELQTAYDKAKTLSPSVDNRITVVVAPGEYKFPSIFIMDTEYIDLVSLTGNRDITFDLVGITDPFIAEGPPSYTITSISECLLIDTDNVYVKGIQGKLYQSPNWDEYWGFGEDYKLPIQISFNLPNIIVENCEGGPYSFGGDKTYTNPNNVSGTFKDCIAQDESFGAWGTASGTFINCVGIINSFGGWGTASGTFTNCKSDFNAFGGTGTSSGTFKDCVGTTKAFGGYGTASGTFTNCIGGVDSFGGAQILSGKLYYCRQIGATVFQTVSGGGRTYYCIDGLGNTNNQ